MADAVPFNEDQLPPPDVEPSPPISSQSTAESQPPPSGTPCRPTVAEMYGAGRVVAQTLGEAAPGTITTLPAEASRLDAQADRLGSWEVLLQVDALWIERRAAQELWAAAGGLENGLAESVLRLVSERGKLHHPRTGTGGLLLATVSSIGSSLTQPDPHPLAPRFARFKARALILKLFLKLIMLLKHLT